jgi:CelD/BcsL family acetyltransferase involved in cellulose biosynthesis
MAIAWGSDRRLFDLRGAPEKRPARLGRRVASRPPRANRRVYPASGCISVTTLAELLELEPLWRELDAHASNPSPFRTWEFTIEWLRHFVLPKIGGATGRFEVAVAFDEHARAIGAVPMFEERALGIAGLGLSLQPFGRSHSLEAMTDEPAVLLRCGQEEVAARKLTAYVAGRIGAGNWDIATLPGGPHRGEPARRSFSWSGRLDRVERTRTVAAPMVVALPSSWQAFAAGLSKSMRDNVAYYPRRLSREVGAWKLCTARTRGEVASAVEQLVQLHRRRSRSSTGVAHRDHIPTETHASFLRAWFARGAERGEVSIHTIEIDGTTIAAQAFLATRDSVSVYYSGYDDRYYRYSPLTIIAAHLIRTAIERGVSRVEFPPGATPWKSRWGAVEGPAHDEISIYAVHLSALLRGLSRRFRLRVAAAFPLPV